MEVYRYYVHLLVPIGTNGMTIPFRYICQITRVSRMQEAMAGEEARLLFRLTIKVGLSSKLLYFEDNLLCLDEIAS